MFETIKYLFRKSNGHLKEIDASLHKTKKDYVRVTKDSDYTTIDVKREIHMNDLFDELKYIDSLYISTDAYIKRDNCIRRQTVYALEKNKLEYVIADNDEAIKITRINIEKSGINKIVIDIDKKLKDSKITKYEYGKNGALLSTKWYPVKNNSLGAFVLERETALNVANEILKEMLDLDLGQLISIDYLDKCINKDTIRK